jgi:predicted metal-dependent peptidase
MLYSDDERIGRLSRMYKELCKHRSVMLHETVKLGYPRFVDELVPTAAVGETEDGRLMYYWNRAFFDSLGIRDRVYVCAHEALHVILGHPLRRKDRDPERWNIACDIAVNTALDHAFYLRLNNKATKLGNRYGPQSIRKSSDEVLQLTAEEIYDLLPSLPGGPGGSIPGTSVDGHDFWDTLTDEQIEQVRRAIAKHLKGRGLGSSGEIVQLERILIKPFPWQKLLSGRLATVKKPREGETWIRPNRKIYQHYPRILLPGVHDGDGNTSRILGTIDTSGSMAQDDIEELAGILAGLPKDEYEVHTTWFDDGVYDAPDLTQVQGRGGTSFQKIEDVCCGRLPIQGRDGKEIVLKQYPDVVVAMTDGYAPQPTLQYPNRWIWILTETGSSRAVDGMGCTVWRMGRHGQC